MSEKKVVNRNVAIALGIISAILVVGLIGIMISYISTIQSKDSQILTLSNSKKLASY